MKDSSFPHFFWIMGEVSDLMREGGGELSSVSDIVVGRASEVLPDGRGAEPIDPQIVRPLKIASDLSKLY